MNEPTLWQHKPGDQYVTAIGRIVGNVERWETNWTVLETSDRLSYAISEGFAEARCDDFNIVAIRKGDPVALLWMNERIDDVPKGLYELLKRP